MRVALCDAKISKLNSINLGVMYTWGEKLANNEWNICRIELALKNDPDKRLLVKK